jgi:hypothetical protein
MSQSYTRRQDCEGELPHTAENLDFERIGGARGAAGGRPLAEQALAHHGHADDE